MQAILTAPSKLTPDQIDRWRRLMHNGTRSFHPQLTPEWARIAERAGSPVEVAEFEVQGDGGLFGYERRSRQRAVPISGHFSDRQAILTPPNSSWNVCELFAACQISRFQFDHLELGDEWIESTHYAVDKAYGISLTEGYEPYWDQLTHLHHKWFEQLERKKRKLSREVGPLRFELHSHATPILDALIHWKRRQINAAGLRDIFGYDWSKRLLVETIKEQTSYFSGWLSALYAGSQLVAAHLGQRSEHVLNAWIPSFHPRYSKYSPGALLHFELLRRSADEGVTQIDLGRGENPLKLRLATEFTPLAIGSIHRGPWRQQLATRSVRTKKWANSVSKAVKWVRRYRSWLHDRLRDKNEDNQHVS